MGSKSGFDGHDTKRPRITLVSSEKECETEDSDDEEINAMFKASHYEEKVIYVKEKHLRTQTTSNIEQTSSSWYNSYRTRVISKVGDTSRHYGSTEYDCHILEKRGKIT